jgi:hypothetical protein
VSSHILAIHFHRTDLLCRVAFESIARVLDTRLAQLPDRDISKVGRFQRQRPHAWNSRSIPLVPGAFVWGHKRRHLHRWQLLHHNTDACICVCLWLDERSGWSAGRESVCKSNFRHLLLSVLTDEYNSRTSFATTGGRQRLITTAILLLLITTLIPYQFAYMVLTIVQLCTCVRALRLARDTRSGAHYNFYNYTTSMLVLMLWVLPINMPVLIVWIHNLAVHWLTPFSTHHNLLAVLPLVLVVEVMSTGKMTPRVNGRARYVTNVLTFLSALYAAIYGVTYAYRLHHLLNILAAWLFAIHISSQPASTSLGGLASNTGSPPSNRLSEDVAGTDVKKRP